MSSQADTAQIPIRRTVAGLFFFIPSHANAEQFVLQDVREIVDEVEASVSTTRNEWRILIKYVKTSTDGG
jgi:hypothetical protein